MERYKILIVDDDPDFLEQVKIMLSSEQFEFVFAHSQKEAEELLTNIKPDLAILDVIMEQDDSGFVLAYKIKKKYPEVPVIILTSLGKETRFEFEPDDNIEKKWIKADKYLEKGIRPDQIQREVFKLLKI